MHRINRSIYLLLHLEEQSQGQNCGLYEICDLEKRWTEERLEVFFRFFLQMKIRQNDRKIKESMTEIFWQKNLRPYLVDLLDGSHCMQIFYPLL